MTNTCGDCSSYRKEIKTCKKLEWIFLRGLIRKFKSIDKIPDKKLMPYQLSASAKKCERFKKKPKKIILNKNQKGTGIKSMPFTIIIH